MLATFMSLRFPAIPGCRRLYASRRDLAVMHLMARLGLRSRETRAIRLNDINWRAGEITVHGKGGRHDHMPLPVDVGEAIADHVMNGQAGRSSHLFISLKAPFCPMQTTLFIQRMLAVNMVSLGRSLDEIGDVLRHRSRATTTIYSSHGIGALRPLAWPWPVRGGQAARRRLRHA